MEDAVGGTTFLSEGGRGGHVAGPSERMYLAESSAEMSAKLATLTKKKAKR